MLTQKYLINHWQTCNIYNESHFLAKIAAYKIALMSVARGIALEVICTLSLLDDDDDDDDLIIISSMSHQTCSSITNNVTLTNFTNVTMLILGSGHFYNVFYQKFQNKDLVI